MLRAHSDERSPTDYMSALEEELSQRPDVPLPPPPPPAPPKDNDAARSSNAAGVTWHSAPTVGQVRTQLKLLCNNSAAAL
jgi:hypothetical protein